MSTNPFRVSDFDMLLFASLIAAGKEHDQSSREVVVTAYLSGLTVPVIHHLSGLSYLTIYAAIRRYEMSERVAARRAAR